MMGIRLRQATQDDSERLFAWRNDPAVQAASRSTAPVTREQHKHFMQFYVNYGYPQHLVLIAEKEDSHAPIGVVRFDSMKSDVMKFEVSISLASAFRGQGLSGLVLRDACQYMSEYTIDAHVKQENIPSRKLFESCGFEEIARKDGILQFRKEPTR